MVILSELGSTQKLDGVEFNSFHYFPVKSFEKAVFLDRDGTLNDIVERYDGTLGAPWELKDFKIKREALKACELLKFHGYGIFVVTNQPDVLDKKMKISTLVEMNVRLKNYLKLDDIQVAFDRNDKENYKPGNGMIEKLIQDFKIDRKQSWMVGDSKKDILAGTKSGLQTIFLGSKYEKELDSDVEPTHNSTNIWEAALKIVGRN